MENPGELFYKGCNYLIFVFVQHELGSLLTLTPGEWKPIYTTTNAGYKCTVTLMAKSDEGTSVKVTLAWCNRLSDLMTVLPFRHQGVEYQFFVQEHDIHEAPSLLNRLGSSAPVDTPEKPVETPEELLNNRAK